jgi:hypothetical protein
LQALFIIKELDAVSALCFSLGVMGSNSANHHAYQMPNWCQNALVITGDLDAFSKWLNGEPFTLNKIKPMPPEYKDGESGQWYDWAVENWGTKWDVDAQIEPSDIEGDNHAYAVFESAWAPPCAAIRTLSELLPTVMFRLSYLEEGVGFCGCSIFKEGMVSEEFYARPSVEGWREFASREFDWKPYDEEEDVKNAERQKAQTA